MKNEQYFSEFFTEAEEKNYITCLICKDLVQVVDDAILSNNTISQVKRKVTVKRKILIWSWFGLYVLCTLLNTILKTVKKCYFSSAWISGFSVFSEFFEFSRPSEFPGFYWYSLLSGFPDFPDFLDFQGYLKLPKSTGFPRLFTYLRFFFQVS